MTETGERGNRDRQSDADVQRESPQTDDASAGAARDASSVHADGGAADDRRRNYGPGGWFAHAATRWALALIGLFIVLFAIGQAFGVPLLGWVAEALASPTGQWLIVAFVGLLIVFAAANLRWR
ncbi:hypothetical protein BRC82_08565 [Halobacteriales archaeon QS_1_67_19]|nr:MAG: hypothetical protein BRC82_08565 [Halobacteriales archaeon QS_1_67_19]